LLAADFILLTGPASDTHRIEDYEMFLQEGAALNIPLICVNPDLSVFVEGEAVLCAGTLAQRYEQLGGYVRHHGKPYPEVYASILAALGVPSKERIVAIGDALATDIKGAATFGLDSALVCTGMHEKELGIPYGLWPPEASLASLCKRAAVGPTYVLPALQWAAK
jgi:HAD superfamily hydrolase (TIGR01459 family)